jgi:hypothetical protein
MDIDPFQLASTVSTHFFSKCEEKLDVVVVDPDSKDKEQQAFINTINPKPLIL